MIGTRIGTRDCSGRPWLVTLLRRRHDCAVEMASCRVLARALRSGRIDAWSTFSVRGA
ncbi:hypothetical protein [Xanthomonas graminis]|uniref:hypothetical protein n=1 Tax=Xanthomonas graminis TaxID=3390026 RepID=UPI0012DA8649|nr:hypothetical protein [Xanthomonas translucens]